MSVNILGHVRTSTFINALSGFFLLFVRDLAWLGEVGCDFLMSRNSEVFSILAKLELKSTLFLHRNWWINHKWSCVLFLCSDTAEAAVQTLFKQLWQLAFIYSLVLYLRLVVCLCYSKSKTYWWKLLEPRIKKPKPIFIQCLLFFFHWVSEGQIQQSEVNPVN